MRKFAALAIAFCLLLCGCDKPAEQTEEKNILDVFNRLEDESVSSEYPIYINGTEINESPKKVVCLSQSLADIVAEMGYGSSIVGIGSYCEAPAGASSPADIGKPTQPDIEKIISLSPDLLLTSTAVANKDIMSLSDNGIKTVYIPYPRSVEEFGRIYNAVGMIYLGMFDGEEAGNTAFAPVSEAFGKASELNCGSFVYITEGFAAAGEQTLENSVLSLFGTSIASQIGITGYSSDISFLSEIEPDYIFLNDSYSIDEIMSDEMLGELHAAANGNIILVDNSYFENPSKSMIALVQDITEKLSAIMNGRGA